MDAPVLRGYQRSLVERADEAWSRGVKHVMGSCATGSGKCLGYGTPVLMHDGTIKQVQDVVVGDLLMGPDSQPRRVLSLARGREPMYRVTPTKGDSYVVNESHILSLRHSVSGAVRNIEVREYLRQHKTFRHVHKGWRTGVDFPLQVQAIAPYMLGLWLGDGSSNGPAFTTADKEVEQAVAEYATHLGLSVRIEPAGGKSKTHYITSGVRRGYNYFRVALQRAGLLGCKHIPHNYLCASRNQRLELLAGLLDSDGHYNNGGYDLISKWKHLADQIAYLARSLGLSAYVSECQKSAHPGHVGTYWRLYISGDCSVIPCRVARQKAKPRAQKKNVLNVGIAVAPIGVGDYYGFEISGDRLFLLGDFTVTHNTVMMGEHAANHNDYGMAIAHRSQLVTQMSLALAKRGIYHNVIGQKAVIKTICDAHLEDHGRIFYNPGANWNVASVNTLVSKGDQLQHLRTRVTRAFMDEAHHVLRGNIWGRAVDLFPNANWWLPTATPERADGRGLGSEALGGSGVVDELQLGPEMRALINDGYLVDYVVRAPVPSDLDMSDVTVGANGEYNQEQSIRAVKRSKKIVGDVVDTYIRFTPNKLGIVFAVDIEHAKSIVLEFNKRGVPCELIDGTMPEEVRRPIMKRYAKRETQVLVNVDLFGEGFDLPAVEVVMMARPTASFSLYAQQWGRALRLLISDLLMRAWDAYTSEQRKAFIAQSDKPVAFIHDHVGNMLHFRGPPDIRVDWDLRDRKRRSSGPSDAIPLRVCTNEICLQPYERFYPRCPYCGMEPPVPEVRSPETVDGDLTLYTPQMLMEMFGVATVAEVIAKSEATAFCPIPVGVSQAAVRSIQAAHHNKQQAQTTLRQTMGLVMPPGRGEQINNRKFFLQFGHDVLAARFLNAKDATALTERILDTLRKAAT